MKLTAVEPPSCLPTEDASGYDAVEFADGGWIKPSMKRTKTGAGLVNARALLPSQSLLASLPYLMGIPWRPTCYPNSRLVRC